MSRADPLTATIAERLGVIPKRTLVVGGLSSFIAQTIGPNLAKWGLKVEWHWPMGDRPRKPMALPAGCEVVVYFSDMVDKPVTWGPALKAATEARPGVRLIRTIRKAAVYQGDLTAAGFIFDANHQLKEPAVPPMPPVRPVAALPAAPAPAPAPRDPLKEARALIDAMVELLSNLGTVVEALATEAAAADNVAELKRLLEAANARAELAARRAETAEEQLKVLNTLRELLKSP